MNCIFARNPYCGFDAQHSGHFCTYNHNPPQPSIYHVNLGYWCGNVCVHCKERFERRGADIELLPPWKLPPWRRPPRPPLLRKPLVLGED